MATAALLPSPRTPSAAAAAANMSSPPNSSNSKANRLSAAADLIRNLDAALSGMNAAAASAAEDAARARRNARAAGEVARRYGGSSAAKGAKGGSGRKRRGDKNDAASNAATSHEGLLERKRERRAAARMAAEARQRRENPMAHALSPRKVSTPRGGAFRFATTEREEVSWTAPIDEDRAMVDVGSPAAPRRSPERAEGKRDGVENAEAATSAVAVEEVQNYSVAAATHRAPAAERIMAGSAVLAAATPPVASGESRDSLANSSYAEYEDAVEEHQHPGQEPNEVGATDNARSAEQRELQELANLYGAAMEGPAAGEDQRPPPVEAPPVDNEYYMQQNSYYNQQQQQTQREQQVQEPYYQTEQASADQGQQQQQQDAADQTQQQNMQQYYDQNQYYYGQQQQQQHAYAAAEQPQVHQQQPPPSPVPPLSASKAIATPKHSLPPTPPPRSQPATTNRIEASHAEDVLTLSLELERVRSQLATTTERLSASAAQVTNLQGDNDRMHAELTALHSQLETHNERSSSQLSGLQQQLDFERTKSSAAEEDAALALELAKEAQTAKEECETWLGRSLEEIDLWKGRYGDAELKLREAEERERRSARGEERAEETKKSVHWGDECPPSPVTSDDGFGCEADGDAGAAPLSSPVVQRMPPPPPPPRVDGRTDAHDDGAIDDADEDPVAVEGITTPSKSAVASGRAYLHRNSPSPLKAGLGGMSPHPRARASELLKKSAETRRLLRERLAPGQHFGGGPRPPGAMNIPRVSSDPSLRGGDFASRQGAACRAVGRAIRESGARLNLNAAAPLLTNGASNVGTDGEGDTVAQLESMVRDYCGSVEGTIGRQRERINELLAFCDHLEREVVLLAK